MLFWDTIILPSLPGHSCQCFSYLELSEIFKMNKNTYSIEQCYTFEVLLCTDDDECVIVKL